MTALRTIHGSFAPKGFTVVVHTNDNCPFIDHAEDILRPDQGILPDDDVSPCRFCAGADPKQLGHVVPTVARMIPEDITPQYHHGTGEGHGTAEPAPFGASEKQVAFINRLLAEKDITSGLTAGEVTRLARWQGELAEGSLSKRGASAVIDWLTARPRAVVTAEMAAEFRWGKRDGTWFARVPVGGSHREGDRIVIHKANGETVNAVLTVQYDVAEGSEWWNCRKADEDQAVTNTAGADVPEGHYAIPSTGDNDLVFYRVDHNERWGVSVKMIVGGHPDTWVKRAHVAGILARINEYGVDAAAKLYGTELGRCSRCNRTLTDETSRALGIGPECRSK